MPRCITWPIAYVVIATLAVDLPDHFLTAVKFTLSLICTAVASSAYGKCNCRKLIAINSKLYVEYNRCLGIIATNFLL